MSASKIAAAITALQLDTPIRVGRRSVYLPPWVDGQYLWGRVWFGVYGRLIVVYRYALGRNRVRVFTSVDKAVTWGMSV